MKCKEFSFHIHTLAKSRGDEKTKLDYFFKPLFHIRYCTNLLAPVPTHPLHHEGGTVKKVSELQ